MRLWSSDDKCKNPPRLILFEKYASSKYSLCQVPGQPGKAYFHVLARFTVSLIQNFRIPGHDSIPSLGSSFRTAVLELECFISRRIPGSPHRVPGNRHAGFPSFAISKHWRFFDSCERITEPFPWASWE